MTTTPGEPRTALVTGASSGIGRATAQFLVDRGHSVVGTSRNPDKIPDADRVEGVRYRALDLRDAASIDGFAGALAAEDVHVDILVNNAGESQSGPLEDLPLGALERLFQVNVLGPVHLTQLLIPAMRARGYGRVVMVGSMLASFPLAYRSSYVASKAALVGLTRSLAVSLGPAGVTVNALSPGAILTEREVEILGDDPHAAIVAAQAVPRRLVPEDLLTAVRFLVADGSAAMTGQVVEVGAGLVLG